MRKLSGLGKSCVVLFSGGIDSLVTAGLMREAHFQTILLHINYGQVTWEAERRSADQLFNFVSSAPPIELSLKTIGKLGTGTLMGQCGSTEEFYPHRNLMLLVAAALVATANDCDTTAIGIIDSENAEFKDCSTNFVKGVAEMFMLDDPPIRVLTPLARKTKAQVLKEAIRLDLPYERAFSCNVRSDRHCWKCKSCIERASAHNLISTVAEDRW